LIPPQTTQLLIGNTFPLTLIRRPVQITPVALSSLLTASRNKELFSFWGHMETLAAANAITGLNLTPRGGEDCRPAITLSDRLFPVLNEIEFSDCWVLSPDYTKNIRPAVGKAVAIENISGWNVLHLTWT
jgi:hypothetical protein